MLRAGEAYHMEITRPAPRPLLFSDPVFLEHRTGEHPESPERLRRVIEHLDETGLLRKVDLGEFCPASRNRLELVHRADYVDSVERFAARGGGRIEADTVVSRRSFEVASKAAGAALAAVDAVLTGTHRHAVCLIRPPGHHALPGSAMGFCLFNNVAVAAEHAREHHQLQRVLIVDWDVHHGNGTQDMFYESSDVCFFSSHRYPFYPGTGAGDETGTRAGLGATFNLPVKFGTPRKDFLSQFEAVLTHAASRCCPELILISAGFDAHRADPVGSLGLETEDFEPLTKLVQQVADHYCQGRLVSLLEGGYNVNALAESVACHLKVLVNS